MTPHECKHEVDLALIAQNIEQILAGQNDIKQRQKEVLTMILGNGKDGLKTRISKAHTKLNVQWALFLALFGLIAYIFQA